MITLQKLQDAKDQKVYSVRADSVEEFQQFLENINGLHTSIGRIIQTQFFAPDKLIVSFDSLSVEMKEVEGVYQAVEDYKTLWYDKELCETNCRILGV